MNRTQLIITILLFIGLWSHAQDCCTVLEEKAKKGYNCQKIALSCADTLNQFALNPKDKLEIRINNGKKADIAVKITIGHMPENATLALHINNRIEVLDWQDGQTYLFQTLDNSGACFIEFIGEPAEESSGLMGSITVSYQVLDQYRIYGLDVDDQMAYYNTVIVSRKAKYIGQPMSVLIQDMDAYDIWIVDFLLARRGQYFDLYDGIKFYFDDMSDAIRLRHGKKYFILFVEFEGYYDGRLIDDVNESGYTNAHKAVFSENLVLDVRLEVLN